MAKKIIAFVLFLAVVIPCCITAILYAQSDGNKQAALAIPNEVQAEVSAAVKAEVTPEVQEMLRSTAAFVEANFDTFIAAYNESPEAQQKSLASYIEASKPAYITTENVYAAYLDFNDENGYVILDGDNNVYAFEVVGDAPYLADAQIVYYNCMDEFLYYDEESLSYIPYKSELSDTYRSDTDTQNAVISQNPTSYDGQEVNGSDGMIYNLAAYVQDRYSGFQQQSYIVLSNYEWEYQGDTSVYMQGQTSEGNCTINAAYSMMNSWRMKGIYPNLPGGNINIVDQIIASDPLYAQYGTNTYNGWSLSYYNCMSMPKLYAELRELGVGYGYIPEVGLSGEFLPDMIHTIGQRYGYNITVYEGYAYDSVLRGLNANKAGLVCVSGSETYGNHAMAVYGFASYKRETGWWIFKQTKWKYFYCVDDGWGYKKNDPKYGTTNKICFFDGNISGVMKLYTYIH